MLPPGVTVAHKTGEVDETRNDCGIVYAKDHDFVFCALTRRTKTSAGSTTTLLCCSSRNWRAWCTTPSLADDQARL
jgi:hypothetical protein